MDKFISYSQHADDYIAWQLLGKKNTGVVIEVGAFDGIHLSNSFSFELIGWQCLAIEPNPTIYKFLEINRVKSEIVNMAVVGDESIDTIDFYAEEIGVLSGVVYDEKDIKKRYENRGVTYKKPKKSNVAASTLTNIINQSTLFNKKIDIISIDVEGFELQVLQGLDLNNIHVSLFIIEANSKKEKSDILNYFEKFPKYLHIGDNHQNLFLMHQDDCIPEQFKKLAGDDFSPAVQKHPVSDSLSIDSVPPNFIKTGVYIDIQNKAKKEVIKIAHIINPVNVSASSDLFYAQPVTFSTMEKARNYVTTQDTIALHVIGYPEDENVYPTGFNRKPFLRRSVLDTSAFVKHRKLPLIGDILGALHDEDVDYIIYSNVDIAVQPYFYDYILNKIRSGSDSLIINRRVVDTIDDEVTMLAEVGKSHPGSDCFVFRKELLNDFELGNVAIGANWIGRVLVANLMVFSEKLETIKNAHLTFHIGDDGAWLSNDFSEFDIHNKKEVYNILKSLKTKADEKTQEKLTGIENFMDKWNDSPLQKSNVPYKRSLKGKIKKKVKHILKRFYLRYLE